MNGLSPTSSETTPTPSLPEGDKTIQPTQDTLDTPAYEEATERKDQQKQTQLKQSKDAIASLLESLDGTKKHQLLAQHILKLLGSNPQSRIELSKIVLPSDQFNDSLSQCKSAKDVLALFPKENSKDFLTQLYDSLRLDTNTPFRLKMEMKGLLSQSNQTQEDEIHETEHKDHEIEAEIQTCNLDKVKEGSSILVSIEKRNMRFNEILHSAEKDAKGEPIMTTAIVEKMIDAMNDGKGGWKDRTLTELANTFLTSLEPGKHPGKALEAIIQELNKKLHCNLADPKNQQSLKEFGGYLRVLSQNKEQVEASNRKHSYESGLKLFSDLSIPSKEQEENPQMYRKRRFELTVKTLLDQPEVRKALENTDDKVLASLYNQSQKVDGEGVGLTLIDYLIKKKKLPENYIESRIKSDDFQKQAQKISKQQTIKYTDYNGEMSPKEANTTTLTRYYVKEFLDQLSPTAQKSTSWSQIKEQVEKDDAIPDHLKRTLVTNFFNSIYYETGESPYDYVQRQKQKGIFANELSVNSIREAQQTLETNSANQIDLPIPLTQVSPDFSKKLSALSQEGMSRFGLTDEAIGNVDEADTIEELYIALDGKTEAQALLGKTLAENGYSDTLEIVNQSRIEAGEEPFAFEIPTVETENNSELQPFDYKKNDVRDYEIGTLLKLPNNQTAQVMEGNMLAIPKDTIGAVPVLPEYANTQTIDRIQNTIEALGVRAKPSEIMLLQQRFNRQILLGAGGEVVNIADGVDTGLIGSKGFLDFAGFIQFVANKHGIETHFDSENINAIGREKHNEEIAFTSEDNIIRDAFGFDSAMNSAAGKIDALLEEYRREQRS